MQDNFEIKVIGLRELRRDLRRIDTSLAKGVTESLREAAQVVADEAKRLAPRGTRPIPPGRKPRKRLVDAIRPTVRRDTAYVVANVVQRSRAWPQGYRYPRRYEYGSRPFLRPALAAKRSEVEKILAEMLDKIANKWEGE